MLKNYDIILKNFCKKKSFKQTIRFVLEKLQKAGIYNHQSVDVYTGVPTDEVKALKLTI